MESRSYRNIAIAFCLLGALAGVTAYRHQDKKSEADKEQTLLDAVSGLARKQEQLEDGSRVGRMKLAELLGATLRRQLDRDRNILGTEGTNSPIKIRGGAMTFRTTDSRNPWKAVKTSSESKIVKCYFLDSADGSFSSISFQGASYTGPGSAAPDTKSLSPGWTLKLEGRSPHDGVSNSSNGIEVNTEDNSCNSAGHSTHSITLTPVTPQSGFYPRTYQSDDTKSQMERFMDNSPGCQGPSSTTSGDEDICERMSTISLVLPGGKTPYTWKCDNGECEIDIDQ